MQKFLKSVAKIAQILITTSLALLLSCNLYLVVMARAFGIENPTIFGYSTAVVVSGSTEPALSVDDLILNHTQDSYEEGDIITFRNGGSLTTHRIVEIADTGYVTQGDANNTPDLDVVQANAVVGRVVWAIPYIGSALAFLKTPLGMVILIFTGLCILELPFFFQRWRDQTDGEELSNIT